MPELWGGSADLAGSNNTTMKGVKSFLPPEQSSPEFSGDYTGRTLHFGIREHAMGNILNAITMSGLTRAYGGTFLVFADYMRGAVRLAAIQKVPSHLRLDATTRSVSARTARPTSRSSTWPRCVRSPAWT